MIVDHKFEYGDKGIKPTLKHRRKEVFNHNNMIFEPVNSINNKIFSHWEKALGEKKYPYAVYLVKSKFKTDNGFRFKYHYTMITKPECIAEINNPPDSEGIIIDDEEESE